MTDKTSLAKTYLAASEHDQGSTLWMQSCIMDHLAHYDISFEDYWAEVKRLREDTMERLIYLTKEEVEYLADTLHDSWINIVDNVAFQDDTLRCESIMDKLQIAPLQLKELSNPELSNNEEVKG